MTAEHGVVIGGSCAAEFEPVAAIFARVVAETPGGGAAVCVYHDGVPVVDLHGVFTRVVGVPVGHYVRDSLAAPLGLRLSFGRPEDGIDDVVPVTSSGAASVSLPWAGPGAGTLLDAAGFGLLDDPTIFNSAPLDTATLPAVGVVTRARDLARLFAATCGPVDGVRLLDPPGLEGMRATHSHGRDRVSGEISHFGAGVMLPSPRIPFLGPGSFSHDGHGGALAAAHPESRTAYAFTTDTVPRIGLLRGR